MSLRIRYDLVGTGWSACEISKGECRVEVTASYLSDALGKLLRGALALLDGMHLVEFGFDEEPGEYRWRLECIGPENVRIRIASLDDLWSYEPFEKGRVVLDIKTELDELALAVAIAAREVLIRHGVDGYREKWVDHAFPVVELERLERILSQSDG